MYENSEFKNYQNEQIKWAFKEINKSKYEGLTDDYAASKTIFYMPINNTKKYDFFRIARDRINDVFIGANDDIQSKLDIYENQLWILRVRYEDNEQLLDFILHEGPTIDKLKDRLKDKGVKDPDHLLKKLIDNPPTPTGVVGETYRSLKLSYGLSVLGDFRTMDIIGANNKIRSFEDILKDFPGAYAEIELYAKHYRDFYSFPIFVGQRFWGVLEIADRAFESESNIDSLESQFQRIWHGITASNFLGQLLEKQIVDAAEEVLFRRISIFLSEDALDDENIINDLSRIYAKVLSSLPFIAKINYHVSIDKSQNKLIDNWNSYNDGQDSIFDLDSKLKDGLEKYKLGLRAVMPVNSYEADRVKEVFQISLKDTIIAQKAIRDAATVKQLAYYKEVEPILEILTKEISIIKMKSQLIQERMNPYNKGYLMLYETLIDLFIDGDKFFDKNNLIFSKGNKIGLLPLTSFHDFKKGQEYIVLKKAWDNYIEVIKAINIKIKNKFLNIFENSSDEDFIINQANLLKYNIHSPHNNKNLFVIQVLVACVAALQNDDTIPINIVDFRHGDPITIIQDKFQSFMGLIKNRKINHLVEHKTIEKSHTLNIDFNISQILSSLIQIISLELQSLSESLRLENVNINNSNNYFRIELVCNGLVNDEGKKELDDSTSYIPSHGLRGYLYYLVKSCGQGNSIFGKPEDSKNNLVFDEDASFKKTKITITWMKKVY